MYSRRQLHNAYGLCWRLNGYLFCVATEVLKANMHDAKHHFHPGKRYKMIRSEDQLCGRFAKFVRWQNTGAPGYERGYLVNCKRCGEVLVY